MSDKPQIASDKKINLPDPGELKAEAVRPELAIHKGEDPDKFHPYRVELLIQENALDVLPEAMRRVVYYVRGPKKRPDLVLTMAHQLWAKWEKSDQGIYTEYPDVMDHGIAQFVDEDDFKYAWNEIRKYKLQARVAGDPDDPMAFTCLGRTDL